MDYRITLHKAWRPGRQLIHPGTYRVPEDMRHEMAERALSQAGATKVEPDKAEPPNTQLTDEEPPAEERSKGESPQNKARGKAPKNKASLGR